MKSIGLIVVIVLGTLMISLKEKENPRPRVFVFTDINIDSGDPDDRQSLIHLLWYADELKIEGIVPDRWNAEGYEACEMVLEAYKKDYDAHGFKDLGYPDSKFIQTKIAKDTLDAVQLFSKAASIEDGPLYVLVWGNMEVFYEALGQNPHLAKNIRLITIGTGLMLEQHIPEMPPNWERSAPCKQLNWNGFGRDKVYNDSRFDTMWWLEINWTYAGMFTGKQPEQMFQKLSKYGNLGMHIKEVVKNHDWAQYFRVGDTPSVLYVLDPKNPLADPTYGSWAGKFIKPFPNQRPNYYTDDYGPIAWNYEDPCLTWENHTKVDAYAKSTLEERRPEMYEALLRKLNGLYGKE